MKRSGIRVYKSQLNPIPNAMNHENNPAKIQSLRHVYPGLRRRAASSGLRLLNEAAGSMAVNVFADI